MLNKSLSKLSIKNAEFYAYHGVKKEEQKLGGKYQVDLDMWYDSTSAVINDDVKYALNYEEAAFCIGEIISNEQYNLVETIANEILNLLMDKFATMQKARVVIRKLSVPMRRVIDHIEVEQTLERAT